jgi:hypothetical protein
MPTRFRGHIAIHTSAKFDMREYEAAMDTIFYNGLPNFDLKPADYPCGSILGTVEIYGCVTASESPWFCGEYGFLLRDPRPLAVPIPIKGSLGLWELPEDVEQRIAAELGSHL